MRRLMEGHAAAVKLSLAIVLVLLVLAGGGVGAAGLLGVRAASGDTEFKVSVTAAQVDGTDPVSTGVSGEPIAVDLRDAFSSGPQTWTIGVSSLKGEMGRLTIKFMDTDPNRKVKAHMSPTSMGEPGPLNNRYYPDLFTQLHFEVLDGERKVWDGKLGTDGEIQLEDPSKNNPSRPGYLKMSMPVDLKPGDAEHTFTMRVYVDSTMDKDELTAYNGTTTGLSLVVKGETL
ncbi:hypothetical protein [Bifidobacterium favimelis]|uniref:Uncharacterized protein n=1 Tax=Bifidobacterium favimelis TaxID=3122979 RepID=A0ABU8ZL85_9BIFI